MAFARSLLKLVFNRFEQLRRYSGLTVGTIPIKKSALTLDVEPVFREAV